MRDSVDRSTVAKSFGSRNRRSLGFARDDRKERVEWMMIVTKG
jgi:hypothetical protein